MKKLGQTPFDQGVLVMALIHICNQSSQVGQAMQQVYRQWKADTNQPARYPWLDLHWFTISVPHPDQVYEGITLSDGLNLGYNVDVKPVEERKQIPYSIPTGGHFVTVLKQYQPDAGYEIAATGILVHPLAVLCLDVITDLEKAAYQPIVIKHPIIREYPTNLEEQLQGFLEHTLDYDDLPQLVNHVDQSVNADYQSPGWDNIHRMARGLAIQ